MALYTPSSPHFHAPTSVSKVMLSVVAALIPGILAYVWFFGPGILLQLLLATGTAIVAEAALLKLRQKPVIPFITDGSALVTASLLALSIPPNSPWWLTVIGILFAIVLAKHLYGGLGYNPFNPAMVAYAILLISFPLEMTSWQAPDKVHTFAEAAKIMFSPSPALIDSITGATPLDFVKTQLGLEQTLSDIMRGNPIFGELGGYGFEWVGYGFLLGGLWLLYKRIIHWQIPVAVIVSLLIMAGLFHLIDPQQYSSPLVHLFSGATILGAFFIATDPVSAATTPKGRLYYGAGIGILTYIIRTWGGYPDGIAFAVLLMNMSAPLIDHYTKPRVFGHGGD